MFETLDAKYIERNTSWVADGLVGLKNVELVQIEVVFGFNGWIR